MKKVLIITYYWPPSGGVGAQRWLKMAKYLPEFGWQPVIFTPDNPDFSVKDESGFSDVRPETEIIKLPIWEPYQLFNSLKKSGNKSELKQGLVLENKNQSWIDKLSIWVRGNMLIPDPKRFWIKPAARFLEGIIESNDIDLIVTTGPPHSMHLIGNRLKKKTGLPWIADFRDPWSKWDLLDKLKTSSAVKNIHKRLEKKVLMNADEVITVSNRLAQELAQNRESEVKVITNGFDEEVNLPDHSNLEDKFIISHVGLLNEMRDPQNLWKVLEELCVENQELEQKLEVRLGGIVSESIMANFEQYSLLRGKIKLLDYMPHSEIYDEYSKASVLLLILNNTDNGKWILPSKLFEYLYTNKPILMLGEEQSDAADILSKFENNSVANFNDFELIKSSILNHFQRFKLRAIANSNSDEVMIYSRKNLTRQLSEMMNKVVAND